MAVVERPNDHVIAALTPFTGAIVARSIIDVAIGKYGTDLVGATPGQLTLLTDGIENGLRMFLSDRTKVDEAVSALRSALSDITPTAENGGSSHAIPDDMPAPFLAEPFVAPRTGELTANVLLGEVRHVKINAEHDILTARGECRTVCASLGFQVFDQVKTATVVSELARNIVQYAHSGHIDLSVILSPRSGIQIVAIDNGTGIPDIDHVLSGQYNSKTGMGMGLLGTKRIMDEFSVETGPMGTTITARRYVP